FSPAHPHLPFCGVPVEKPRPCGSRPECPAADYTEMAVHAVPSRSTRGQGSNVPVAVGLARLVVMGVGRPPHAERRGAAAVERIACSWCHYENEPGRTSCGTCGAPLDVANAVSESGWRAAPRLREMAEFRVGNVTCQIAGKVVPVAEFTLAGNILNSAGRRPIAGMPPSVIEAGGPGRIAVTRDASGEVVVLPLHPGIETDVRGHAFLAASQNV